MDQANLIALGGSLPANCHSDISEDLGVYKKQSERVNGRPTYVKVDDDERAIWYDDGMKQWRVGVTSNLKAYNVGQCV